jgi:hypothetical protein
LSSTSRRNTLPDLSSIGDQAGGHMAHRPDGSKGRVPFLLGHRVKPPCSRGYGAGHEIGIGALINALHGPGVVEHLGAPSNATPLCSAG